MNIFLAPHNDDEALFGSFIIQRAKPLIIVCTDGAIHEKRFGIPAQRRRDESIAAAKILGARVEFLGILDEELSEVNLHKALTDSWIGSFAEQGVIFAPALTGGSPHHDIVSNVASGLGNTNLVLFYGTYSRENFSPTGEQAIIPTEKEKRIKEEALACYTSQHGINKPHFDAVKDVPEYLSFKQ